jgi:hypothetical protein
VGISARADRPAGAAELPRGLDDAGGHRALGELAPGTRVVDLLVADLAVDLDWVSVSMFILMTPLPTASAISASVEPDPPWNTRSSGLAPVPYFAAMPAWISPSSSGRSFTLPGL